MSERDASDLFDPPPSKRRKIKRSHDRTVRLYIDGKLKTYWRVFFSDPEYAIEMPLLIDTLKKAKRGYPWECWVAKSIKTYAEENPSVFPHPVLYVYVTRSTVFIVDRLHDGQPSHAIRYVHNLSSLIREFDKLSKTAFLQHINGTRRALNLTLRPRKERVGEYKGEHRSRKTFERTKTVLRGWKQRAIDAGLWVADTTVQPRKKNAA